MQMNFDIESHECQRLNLCCLLVNSKLKFTLMVVRIESQSLVTEKVFKKGLSCDKFSKKVRDREGSLGDYGLRNGGP